MRLAWRPNSSAYREVFECSASGRLETKSIRTERSYGATENPAIRIPSRCFRRNWQKRGGDGGFGVLRVVRWMRHSSGSADRSSRFSPRPHSSRTISFSPCLWTFETIAPGISAASSAITCLRRKASIAPHYRPAPLRKRRSGPEIRVDSRNFPHHPHLNGRHDSETCTEGSETL